MVKLQIACFIWTRMKWKYKVPSAITPALFTSWPKWPAGGRNHLEPVPESPGPWVSADLSLFFFILRRSGPKCRRGKMSRYYTMFPQLMGPSLSGKLKAPRLYVTSILKVTVRLKEGRRRYWWAADKIASRLKEKHTEKYLRPKNKDFLFPLTGRQLLNLETKFPTQYHFYTRVHFKTMYLH